MTRRTTTLMLENAYCLGGSAQTLEQALREVPGVRRAYVNPVTEAAYVDFDADQCTDADLIRVVESLGIKVGRRHSRPDPGRPTSPTITRSQS